MVIYSFFIYFTALCTNTDPPWLPKTIDDSWRTIFSLIYSSVFLAIFMACGFVRRRFRYGSRLQCTIHRLVEADAIDMGSLNVIGAADGGGGGGGGNGISFAGAVNTAVAAGRTRRKRRSIEQVTQLAGVA
jgi:hypothetical protein